MSDLVDRSVRKVRCPKCNSRTKVFCVDELGRPIARPHAERVEKYARHKGLIGRQRAAARMSLEEREAYRQKVRAAVACSECGAQRGEKCIGRRGHRRLAVCSQRIVAHGALIRA